MPGAQMIMAPGMGGYMQYPGMQGMQGIHPAALGMQGLGQGQMSQLSQLNQLNQLNQMGMQPFIIQPMAMRPTVSFFPLLTGDFMKQVTSATLV